MPDDHPAEPRRIGFSIEVKPHAFDPVTQPELFEGVLARRTIAFLIDLTIIGFPVLVASLFIFLFGIVTFGLGWLLFWLLSPAAAIWALAYYGLTFGSPASATIGMRMVGIEMRTWYGPPVYALLGMVHAILYWILVSTLTPLIVLVGFFNERRRLPHDFFVGTVVINNDERAASLRREPPTIT
jgi:uncharacterized RDD family membrane protein YckC